MKQLQPFLAALLLALCANAAWAERTPPRALPPGDDGNTRVIVKFRPTASLLRAHALSATDHAATALALDRRAGVLGARVGLALKAGAAVTDNVQVVQSEGVNARALATRLALDPDVEYAVVDRRARRLLVPNDPRFASVPGNGPAVGQWYLRAPSGEVAASIDAVSAWDTTTGSAGVIVAVVDTGVRTNHPDLTGKVLPGYDMISDAAIANDGDGRDADAADPGDWTTATEANDPNGLFYKCGSFDPTTNRYTGEASSWHGTQVAGIVGAATNNGSGMAGAGWNVRVLPVRVLGKCFGYTSDIIDGMRWAAGLHVPGVPDNLNPARVINLSLGSSDACSTPERDAIAEINAAGVVVVAAAGNSEGLAAGSPANCPGVIGVAALRHVGTKVGFSDVGPEISIAAPGGNCVNSSGACLYPILTTADNGTKAPLSPIYTDSFNPSLGTSFSSPLVSATAALMLSVQPTLTPNAVRAAIQASARPFPASGLPPDPVTGALVACHAPNGVVQDQCYCTTTTCGAGMLDAGAAVRAALCSSLVIAASPSAPVPGQAFALSSCGSTLGSGRSIVAWQWSLVDAGSTGSVFVGSTAAAGATLQTATAGTVTVQLVATDDLGAVMTVQQSITVAEAAAPAPPAPSGGGGGALSWPWLLALLLAAAALAPLRPRRSC